MNFFLCLPEKQKIFVGLICVLQKSLKIFKLYMNRGPKGRILLTFSKSLYLGIRWNGFASRSVKLNFLISLSCLIS